MIYVLGSINIDLVMKTQRFPLKGETINGEKFFINHGGKGANQAVAVAKTRGHVNLIGAVGNDSFGQDALFALKAYGVNVDNVDIKEGHTGIASIWLSDSDNSIIIESGANAKIDESMINHALEEAKKGDILVVQLEIPIYLVNHALMRAKQKEMTTLLNPAPYQEIPMGMLKYVDILCVNDTEYHSLVSQDLEDQVPKLIHTQGAKGVLLKYSNETHFTKAYHVDVVDTTAAGDTFIGAFISAYERTLDMIHAIEFGNAAAALSVTQYGAQQSIPSYLDVIKFMEEHNHD